MLPDSTTQLPPARRTMADITALFMKGAGPAPARPQRIAPRSAATSLPGALAPLTPMAVAPNGNGQSRPTQRPQVQVSSPEAIAAAVGRATAPRAGGGGSSTGGNAPQPMPAPTPRPETLRLPLVQTALLDHSTAGSYRVLLEAAKLLAAQHKTAIGIIGRDECVLRLSRVDGGSRQKFKPTAIPAKQGALDVQLARQLFALRQTVDHWLIAVPRLGLDLSRKMLEAAPDWLLVSATDNDAVIASYRLLKGVCSLPNSREASIRLLLQTPDRPLAGRIHARLNNAAQEFLQQELSLIAPSGVAEAHVEPIAEFSVVAHDGDDSEIAWLAVLEFLRDLQNIDPEEDEREPAEGPIERAAAPQSVPESQLCDELSSVCAAVVAEVETAEPPAAKQEPAPPRPAAPVPQPVVAANIPAAAKPVAQNGAGISVFEGPASPELAALRNSLADLVPDAVFLDARPPHDAASLLAAERDGTLHVWLLADNADLTSWGSLWQWVHDHRQLISLTRPDLALRADSPVSMHLILPPGAPRAVRMPPPGIFYYRLHTLKWDGRTATAVIPLG